ncbi:MAG: Holliday junction resolvase RuvX [Acidobacteriota bacterium]|nr:Holliday junction resolvase RuvX [Acidobacteriota bacterium]
MRILGIDFGDKNIGLAVTDKLSLTAQGLGQYKVKNPDEDKKYFKNLAEQYEISKIVIGLPLKMDGTQGSRVQKTKKFARWLEEALNLPVVFWDERLTTKQTIKILNEQKFKQKKKKQIKDKISAVIILSSYLEARRTNSYDIQNH